MTSASTPSVLSCRWGWCRSSFASIHALDIHVKCEHIWPMKPMGKADIALMRRMDRQSLHSSLDTQSSILSGGPVVSVSESKAPLPTSVPQTPRPPDDDAFTQLSSPLQEQSPQRLPASPAFEGLVRQDGQSALAAAVEVFERVHGCKQRPPFHSSTHLPLSDSSGSSQDAVEQHLTQDDVGSQLLLPSELQVENELVDAELRWPTDDELDPVITDVTQSPEQTVSWQNSRSGQPSDSTRGQNFRHGSLNVPLGINGTSPHTLQGSHSESQPIVLQTQAPYFSQGTGWSQTP